MRRHGGAEWRLGEIRRKWGWGESFIARNLSIKGWLQEIDHRSRKRDGIFEFLQPNGSQGQGVPVDIILAVLLRRSSNATQI